MGLTRPPGSRLILSSLHLQSSNHLMSDSLEMNKSLKSMSSGGLSLWLSCSLASLKDSLNSFEGCPSLR
jgi:hypothetical protein